MQNNCGLNFKKNSVVLNDSLKQYLKEIDIYPLLTFEEEKILSAQIIEGLKASSILNSANDEELSLDEFNRLSGLATIGNAARNKLINSNLKLAFTIAKQYSNSAMELSDLVQEANMGLIKAVLKYDASLGNRFSTYATWWIRQQIIKAINNQSRIIRLPSYLLDIKSKLKKTEEELRLNCNYNPSIEELAEASGVDYETVVFLYTHNDTTLSLDDYVRGKDNDVTLESFVPDESDDPCQKTLKKKQSLQIMSAIDSLPFKESYVIKCRYGFNGKILTLDEIGKVLGVSRERVRQIEVSAIKRLKTFNLNI